MEEKLKTLKDFGIDSVGKDDISDVRFEAIKWIKELNKHAQKGSSKIPKKLRDFYYCADTYQCETDSVDNLITWIKHFFNITDEELSNK